MLRQLRPKPHSRKRRGPPITKRVAWIVGIALMGLLIVVGQAMYRHDALIAWRESLREGGTPLEWPQWNPTWPPLQRPTRASRHRIVAADLSGPYAYAALNKDLVSSMPCYCGCRRIDHQSNLSCFVRDFTPNGVPIWTDHAFTCPICVNIISDVSVLKQQGLSTRAIREAIDEHYGSWFQRPTRTPMPPATAAHRTTQGTLVTPERWPALQSQTGTPSRVRAIEAMHAHH